MKLHANARTCPNSRRLLVDRVACRVVGDGGGRGRRNHRPHGASVAGPLAGGGPAGLVGSLVGARGGSRTRRRPTGSGDLPAAPAAPDRGGDRRVALGMPLSTVSAVLQREGLGKRSRLEPPEPLNRYERRRAGRADPHRHQEARPDPHGPATASPAAAARPATTRRTARRRCRLGIRSRRDRRLQPPGLRRGPRPTRRPRPRSVSCAARSRSSPATASPSSAS